MKKMNHHVPSVQETTVVQNGGGVEFAGVCLVTRKISFAKDAHCDIRTDDLNFLVESSRKAAYKQYILWRYGELG